MDGNIQIGFLLSITNKALSFQPEFGFKSHIKMGNLSPSKYNFGGLMLIMSKTASLIR